MAQNSPTLEGLATTIAELTKALAGQLKDANHPEPSFAADSPSSLPPTPEIQGVRLQLVEALSDLLQLATGPSDYIFQQSLFVSPRPFTAPNTLLNC
jgi:hypothetical protein